MNQSIQVTFNTSLVVPGVEQVEWPRRATPTITTGTFEIAEVFVGVALCGHPTVNI